MAQLNGSNVISIKSEAEFSDVGDWSNELDHLPLLQRRKLLLSGKPTTTSNGDVGVKKEDEDSQVVSVSGSCANVREGSIVAGNRCLQNGFGGQDLVMSGDCNSEGTKANANVCSNQVMYLEVNGNGVGIEKYETGFCTLTQNLMVRSQPAEVKAESSNDNVQSPLGDSMTGSAVADTQVIKVKSHIPDDFADDLDHVVLRERLRMLLPRKMLRLEKPNLEGMDLESNPPEKLDSVPATTNSMASSSLSNMIKVKAEPFDNHELHSSDRIAVATFSVNKVPVKTELEIPNELYEDKLDHMQLQDRINMQTKGKNSVSKILGNSECLHKAIPSDVKCGSTDPEAPDPLRFIRPRKRKKTATDSVETALEEDAPGILQVLVEQGVSLEEIKLYGEADDDEAMDESFIEDGFGELEAVMSKTRYLRFRNWPAEWGWCRDLQSFVFVFEKHNRIVLERPEYGYATYFFELVDSISVDWQIKRLVTAMKLTNCGRISVIENRPLLSADGLSVQPRVFVLILVKWAVHDLEQQCSWLGLFMGVGEDITEGEAQVLTQYGWTPNSGLGTMLNYRDRVFHDRKNEKDSSEWRLKIGKLLMNGFNGGSIVSNNIETELIQHNSAESPQIKLEL
ncbi:unnamed protein product [Dovyalis caffra]|uniref:G-patch domain-containing protein n=1 Tax=Dovyalis caffra TaxID=77055 RepID=A0AAV1RQN5_9ROSI|nr:unnamed protein product [Dovyalis caffra]